MPNPPFPDTCQPPSMATSKRHHVKPTEIWSVTEKPSYKTTQATDFTDKFDERHRAAKPVPPYKHWSHGRALRAVSSVAVDGSVGSGDAVEYVSSVKSLLAKRLEKVTPPKMESLHSSSKWISVHHKDYGVDGFQIKTQKHTPAGLHLGKEPVSMRQIMAHRANDPQFTSPLDQVEASDNKRHISTLLMNEQYKRPGLQKFCDGTLPSPNQDKGTYRSEFETSVFIPPRRAAFIIPKKLINKSTLLKDGPCTFSSSSPTTQPSHIKVLRREAEEFLKSVESQSQRPDRFFVTTTGSEFLVPFV